MASKTLKRLMATLGYVFNDTSLLQLALTHRSFKKEHNERLEFLGDAVLGLVIAQVLFENHPESTEGELSHTRAHLVCETSLAQVAQQLELSQYIRLGSGEVKQGGEKRPAILADTLEAIIGAIYLDGGLIASQNCILNWYAQDLQRIVVAKPSKDPKTQLQEYLQARKQPLPQYHLVAQTGSPHEPLFEVSCEVHKLPEPYLSIATAQNRRQAEQKAAEQLLIHLKSNPDLLEPTKE